MVNLSEAFKKLDLLEEEDFNLSDTDSFTDMANFVDASENAPDVLTIYDIEAETEDDLEDSYVGKVILDCDICHSKIYKAAEDIIIDDIENLANVGEECPYCHSNDGFVIIGQVAPFGQEEEEEIEPEEEPVAELEEPEEEESENSEDEEDEIEESLEESFENIHIETEDQSMDMVQDLETGKITVETEIKQLQEEPEEVLAPLEPEVQAEIENNTAEEEPAMDEINYDFDEFDEDSFNELGEGYLKEVYNNVDSFTTSSVKNTAEGKLIVEGIIKFNSGKEKLTQFIFEASKADRKGNLRFLGENAQLSRGKKSFALRCSLNENVLSANSLNYNYRAKGEDGNSIKLYGTVKKK